MALQAAPSATRAVEIIRFLADHPGEVFPVADLSRRVGQSRATCQSVLLALEPSDWVLRTKDGYRLGSGLIAVGAAARQGTAIVGLLRDAIQGLHERTGCEVLGYLPAGDQLINVGRVGPNFPGSITMVEGQVFPLVPPYGLAFVAWTEHDLDAWISRAGEAGPPLRRRLRKAAELVRQLGYSVILDPATRRELGSDLDQLSEVRQKFIASALAHDELVARGSRESQTMGVSLLSGPIFDSDGRVIALMGLVFNVGQHVRLAEMVSELREACRQLSGRLGAPRIDALEDRPA